MRVSQEGCSQVLPLLISPYISVFRWITNMKMLWISVFTMWILNLLLIFTVFSKSVEIRQPIGYSSGANYKNYQKPISYNTPQTYRYGTDHMYSNKQSGGQVSKNGRQNTNSPTKNSIPYPTKGILDKAEEIEITEFVKLWETVCSENIGLCIKGKFKTVQNSS